MAYDFKKEFRDLYQPKAKPSFVDVPAMTFAAVAGTGDPNEEGGAYSRALELLYAFSYAVKMSKMGDWQPEGYFDYVVPPLEGLWWGGAGVCDGYRCGRGVARGASGDGGVRCRGRAYSARCGWCRAGRAPAPRDLPRRPASHQTGEAADSDSPSRAEVLKRLVRKRQIWRSGQEAEGVGILRPLASACGLKRSG